MDPNATLDMIRFLRGAVFAGTADIDDIRALAEACVDLDDWIRKGGFLPDAWTNSPAHEASASYVQTKKEEKPAPSPDETWTCPVHGEYVVRYRTMCGAPYCIDCYMAENPFDFDADGQPLPEDERQYPFTRETLEGYAIRVHDEWKPFGQAARIAWRDFEDAAPTRITQAECHALSEVSDKMARHAVTTAAVAVRILPDALKTLLLDARQALDAYLEAEANEVWSCDLFNEWQRAKDRVLHGDTDWLAAYPWLVHAPGIHYPTPDNET